MRLVLYPSILCIALFLCSLSLQAQTPQVTSNVPAENFVGEQFCFPVSLENNGAPGYSPYIRLILPPDISFDNASFNGNPQSVQNLGTIPAAPNNFLADPILVDNGIASPTSDIVGPAGGQIILLEYPVGSLVDGGITLNSEVCVTISTSATIGTPLDITVQGVYEFGDTPTGANGPILGSLVTNAVTPTFLTFNKSGPGNINPGNCHSFSYTLTANLGNGSTITGTSTAPIIFTDTIPAGIQYIGNLSLPSGCTADTVPSTTTPGGLLQISCVGTFTGTVSGADLQIEFDAHVADTLDKTICDQLTLTNQASLETPGIPNLSSDVDTEVEHVTLNHTANVGQVVPGDIVNYAIDFSINEYTAGLNQASLVFVVPDGMQLDPPSITFAGSAVAPGNLTIIAGPGTGSTVTVNLTGQLGANILPCNSPILNYNATVLQNYNSGDPVLGRDPLENTSDLTYGLVEGAGGCLSESSATVNVEPVSIQKSILSTPPTGPGRNGEWWPGDIVTYQLVVSIPSGDLNDVVISDFFPLPVHDVSDLAASFGTDVRFGTGSGWTTNPTSYVRDVNLNALIMDFGDISDGGTGNPVDIILEIDIPLTTEPYADGLLHTNYMQLNSDNSNVDNITGITSSNLVVRAPDLGLVKGVNSIANSNATVSPIVTPVDGNGSDADGSDAVEYRITIENIGGANGYDIIVSDLAPTGLQSCALNAVDPVVSGSGTPIPFTGGFSGNSLTLNISDPISFNGASGASDEILVTYTCDIEPDVDLGVQLDNTASVTWASTTGATTFPAETDDARVSIARPDVDKRIAGIFPGYQAASNRVHIGESVQYRVNIFLPEGDMQNVELFDQLDAGLAFVSVDSIVPANSSGSPNITTSATGGFPGVIASATFGNTGSTDPNLDRQLTLDMGTIQNFDTDNIIDTLIIYYTTVVINHTTNDDGDNRNNNARLRWDNPNGTGRLTESDQAPNVRIVEPQLTLTKSFTPQDVLPGGNSFVTLTIENPASSSADAFDVNLTDLLPAGMSFVTGFNAGGTASISNGPIFNNGVVTAQWDTIRRGEFFSLSFEVQASSAITPCVALTNCGTINWSSIAQPDEASIPAAVSSSLGAERTGATGDPGGAANDYRAEACADLNVVADNTFDPFITGNSPACEGDRIVLRVREYNGNVVTYNWSGPGVPPGFNNNQLVLDPVQPSDEGAYTVVVELDGCVTDTSNTYQLVLNPKPGLPNITPSNPTVCEGEQVAFSTDSISGSYSYAWTGPNGFSGNSPTPPILNPVELADAGTYSLVITNAQGCQSDLALSTLTVLPAPNQPALNYNDPLCQGEDLVLNSSAAGDQYIWIAPNGNDTVTTTKPLVIPPKNPYYIGGPWRLVVQDSNACASSSSLPIEVNIRPRPQTPLISNNTPICTGDDAILSTGEVTNAFYAWYTDPNLDTLVSTAQNATISGLTVSSSPHDFYLQITVDGCLSDTAQTIITVNAQPPTPLPSFQQLCSDDTLYLAANTPGMTQYIWSGPAGFISNLENPVIPFATTNPNAGSYGLTVVNATGCEATNYVQVDIPPQPQTPTLQHNGPLCEGEDLLLSILPYTGNVVQYFWRTPQGDTITNTPSLNVLNTVPSNSGRYGVSVIVDGCESLPDSTLIEIFPTPATPNIPADFSVCQGEPIPLSTSTSAATYVWTGPDGYSSNLPSPTVVASADSIHAGTYSLYIIDANGCQSADTTVTVTVFPQPAAGVLSANMPSCAGTDLLLSTTGTAAQYRWTAPNGADTLSSTASIQIDSSSSFYQNGVWTLVLIDANGCESEPSNATVNFTPVPATPAAFNNGPICVGGNVKLSTTAVPNANYFWYDDAALTNLVSTDQNPSIINITSTTTYYIVIVLNGCTSEPGQTTVTVRPVPAPPTVPNDTVLCAGDSLLLSTPTMASGYNWTGPNGYSSNLQQPAALAPISSLQAGRYYLSIIDMNGCPSPADSFELTVVPVPTAPTLSSNAPICQGAALTLNTTASATQYQWLAPDGSDTTTASNSITVSTGSAFYQSGDWTLRVLNANGCSSDTAATLEVNIFNPSTAPPAFNTGPICIGGSIILSTTPLNGASYAWYSDAGLSNLIGTSDQVTLNNITQDSSFYLTVSLNGCTSPVGSTLVTTYTQPPAPAIPADFSVCEGEAVALSTTVQNANYFWTGPNGFSSNLQNPAVTSAATNLTAGTYTLYYEDNAGCVSSDSSLVISVDPSPTAPSLSQNSPICNGTALVLRSSGSCASYEWIAPSGLRISTTADSLVVTAGNAAYQSGDWQVACISAAGCSSLSPVSSVTIYPTTPTPAAFNNGPACNGETVQLSASSINNASYAWYDDAALTNLISTQQNPTVVAAGNQSYYLQISVNGCSSSIDSTLVSTYPAPAPPNVPAGFAVCEGSSISLSSSTVANGYLWNGPNGFVSTNQNPAAILNANSVDAGNYQLQITDANGCTSAPNTVAVTVNPNPAQPDIVSNSPICSDDSLRFSTTALCDSYQWIGPSAATGASPGGGNVLWTTANQTAIPSTSPYHTGGAWYVVCIDVNGCESSSNPISVEIETRPAAPLASNTGPICTGESVQLSSSFNSNYLYSWYADSSLTTFLGNGANLSLSSLDSTQTFYVTASNGSCVSMAGSTTAQVDSLPAMPMPSYTPLCQGDTLRLFANTTASSYQWTGPNGFSSMQANPVIANASPVESGTYTLQVTNAAGCTNMATVEVDIRPRPFTPSITSNAPICEGTDLNLQAQAYSGTVVEYIWTLPSGATQTTTTPQLNISNAAISDAGSYALRVEVNGCSSLSNNINVTIHANPAAPAVPADFALCEDDVLSLSSSSSAAAYFWTGPNGFVSNQQNPASFAAELADAGTYSLQIENAAGCRSASSSLNVSVNARPAAPVLSSNSAICAGEDLRLSTTAVASTYTWTAPNGDTISTTVDSLIITSGSPLYQAGAWQLETRSANGCASEGMGITQVEINSQPNTPVVFNSGPFCVGDVVEFSTPNVAGASYAWYSDSSLTNLLATSNETSLVISDTTTLYVTISINGCVSDVGQGTAFPYPPSAAPNVPADFTVCEGSSILLNTNTQATAYNWTGPNGFSSGAQNPGVTPSADPALHPGIYTLSIVDMNGCVSQDSSLSIAVNPEPQPALVSNNSPLCEGDSLVLNANGAAPGSSYEWYDAATGQLVGTGQSIGIANVTTAQAGDYYVVTGLSGCNSVPSAITNVVVETQPNLAAFAGVDIALCDESNTQLSAATPSSGTGNWNSTSSAIIANPNNPNTDVYNLPLGTSTFYWSLSRGSCSDYSVDSMRITVSPNSNDVANAGINQELCGVDSISLNATPPSSSTGLWTQSSGQASLGVVIANPNDPNTAVTGLQNGQTYTFNWTLSNGSCENFSSDNVQYIIDAPPVDNAFAGANISLCDQNTTNLNAFSSPFGTGMWTSSSSAVIINPTDANTVVANLPQDTSVFYWTLSNGSCTDYSIDSIQIVVSNTAGDTAEAGLNQVICGQTTVQLQAIAPSIGTGRWSQSASQAASGATITAPNNPNSNVTGLQAGQTYNFTWSLSNGACANYSTDATSVTVVAAPTDNAFAGNDIFLCGNSSVNLDATVPTQGGGIWSSSSSATIVTPSSATSLVSNLPVGSSTFVWTLSDGPCASYDSDTVTITVTPPTNDVANAGLDSSYCGLNTVSLYGNTPSAGGGTWTQTPQQASLGVVINNPMNPNTTVSNLQISQTYTFTWTLSNGGCVDYSSDDVVISIDALPTDQAFAGTDASICGLNSTNLTATAPSIGTGFWTTASTASISNPNNSNTVVNNLPVGSSTFIWTLSNGSCVDYSVDSVTITLSQPSSDVAEAGIDQTYCGLDSINLQALTPTTATGVWTQPSSQASQGVTILNPSAPNTAVTGLQNGQVYNFTWTLSSGNCADYDSDAVTITINQLPSNNAFAGNDIALCNQSSTNLAAFPPTVGTGMWSTNSTAIIIDASDPTSVVANLPQDTSVFYWTLSNGSCQNYSVDSMYIVAGNSTGNTAEAGVNQTLCGQNTASLQASPPTAGFGTWSQSQTQAASGVVILDPNDPTTTITGLQPGQTFSFTWSLSNGSCINYSTDITSVTVTNNNPIDNAFAGNDIFLCGNNSVNLNATAPNQGTGVWTSSSSASIVNPSNPSTLVANLPLGSSTFVWTLSNGPCSNFDSDTVVVIVTQPTNDIANAGLDSAYCGSTTVNLNGNTPSAGSGTWSQTAQQASLGVTIDTPSNPNSSVSNLIPGQTYTFTWTLSNGGCVDYSSDDVNISIDVLPSDQAFAGNDLAICGLNSTPLAATPPSIGTGFWSTNTTAIISSPNLPNSTVSNLAVGTSSFVWTLSNGSCVDYSTDTVEITLAQPSSDVADAGFNQTYCGLDSITLNAVPPATATGQWSQPSTQAGQGVVIIDPSNPSTSVIGLQDGQSYQFTWSLSSGNCANYDSDDIVITIDQLPNESAFAGTDIVVCSGNSTLLDANAPSIGTGLWSHNSTAIVISPSNPNSNAVNLASDTTVFYWSLSNGSCTDYSVDSVQVIVAPTNIDIADAGLDIEVCGTDSTNLVALNPTLASGEWSQPSAQASLGIGIEDPNDPNTAITGLQAGQTYQFTWTLSSGACANYDSDAVLVTVSALPSDAAFAGDDAIYCTNATADLTATAPTQGTGVWTTNSTATIVSPTNPSTEITNLQQGTNTFIWTLSNGVCTDYSTDTIVITVEQTPIANADSFSMDYNEELNGINLISNDELNSDWFIDIVQTPNGASVINYGDGTVDFSAPDVLGTQVFVYELCNPNCAATFCDTAAVTVQILGGSTCNVPNIFTPNGDGANDALIIPCMENFPDSELIVFNRWGDRVYYSDDYDNRWEGTFNDKPVPDGTYFYILRLTDGSELQGFVEIRR